MATPRSSTTGRAADAGLPLDEAGVWERHLQIEFQRGTGFTFTAQPDALALVNGERAGSGAAPAGAVSTWDI